MLRRPTASFRPRSWRSLDRLGGFEALAEHIPATDRLEVKSRIHHAFADPLRLTTLHLVRDQPLCVRVINRFMRISDSKLSYHLTILKDAGLIEGEYHGYWIIYSITGTGSRYLSIWALYYCLYASSDSPPIFLSGCRPKRRLRYDKICLRWLREMLRRVWIVHQDRAPAESL
ncbi:MAG: metalloregulator ArsR/SmtB family transcription factor [Methanoregula sp.]